MSERRSKGVSTSKSSSKAKSKPTASKGSKAAPKAGTRVRKTVWRGTAKRGELLPFDAVRYLGDDSAIAEYISAALELDDVDTLLLALGDVARARGMAEVARKSGLGRESLYKALAPGAKPRFDTVIRVASALGVRLTARVA